MYMFLIFLKCIREYKDIVKVDNNEFIELFL